MISRVEISHVSKPEGPVFTVELVADLGVSQIAWRKVMWCGRDYEMAILAAENFGVLGGVPVIDLVA